MANGRTAWGQAQSADQLQQHYHRAETAWKNRTSLLEAKVRVDQILEQAPDHEDALKLRAEVLMAMKRYREAVIDSKRATELNPDDAAAHLILAEAARLTGNKPMARRSLERAAVLSVNEGADFHLKLSQSALLLGPEDWGRAESYARLAYAKEPDNAEAYYQLARVFVLRDNADAGATILEQGFEAEMVDTEYIRNDTTLNQLLNHEQLARFF